MLNMMFAFIAGLACLHVFWLYLLLNGLVRRFKSKNFVDGVSIGSSVNRDAMEGSKTDNWTTKREPKWIEMKSFTKLANIIKDIIGKKIIIELDNAEILIKEQKYVQSNWAEAYYKFGTIDSGNYKH